VDEFVFVVQMHHFLMILTVLRRIDAPGATRTEATTAVQRIDGSRLLFVDGD
jgi:hypothetical protein